MTADDEHPDVFPGIYRGVVVYSVDPLGEARLQVTVPSVHGPTDTFWADACLAPNSIYKAPAEGSLVWICFEHGDPEHPVWLGALTPDAS